MSDEETKRNANGLDTVFMKGVFERMKELLHMEVLDEESSREIERTVIVRISTKHINLWICQLEMKNRGNA